MTEHVHEWKWDIVDNDVWFHCECGVPIGAVIIEARLNEYETLKAATERLSAELAREIGDCLYAGIIDHERKAAVLAYADILEGK